VLLLSPILLEISLTRSNPSDILIRTSAPREIELISLGLLIMLWPFPTFLSGNSDPIQNARRKEFASCYCDVSQGQFYNVELLFHKISGHFTNVEIFVRHFLVHSRNFVNRGNAFG
jgi:hypothetical protein